MENNYKETEQDKFNRLKQMAENEFGDWDFSENDTQALKYAVGKLEILKDSYSREEMEELLKKQRENDFAKILNGLTVFTEKPIGDLEGDLCDWNKPSVFAHNYSPQELQDAVVKRIKETFTIILNAPQPPLK